jgi:hypothetical protein
LRITNRGKDYYIEQLQKDREHFVREREALIEKLMGEARRNGEIETRLLQLEAPKQEQPATDPGEPVSPTRIHHFDDERGTAYTDPQRDREPAQEG